MKYFKKLLGDRIYLSPLAADEEEIELFAKWLNDFETSDYIGRSNAITTFEGEKEFLTKTESLKKGKEAEDGAQLVRWTSALRRP